MFAPIVIVFALASPEGIQGLAAAPAAAEHDWTLTRRGIPPRPAHDRALSSTTGTPPLDPAQPILTVRRLTSVSAHWSSRRTCTWRCIPAACTA